LVKRTVVDEDTLLKVVLRAAVAVGRLVDQIWAILGCGATDGERKLATGVLTAVENVGNGVTGLLAWKTSPENGGDVLAVVERVDKYRADGVDNDDGVVAKRRDVLDKSLAVLPESKVVAVTSIAWILS
jgi:hypothetical protein